LAPPPTAAIGPAMAQNDDDDAAAAAAPDKELKTGTQPVSRAEEDDLAAGETENPGAALDEGRGGGTTVPPSLAA
jgi:hypothetical protein